MEINIGQNTHNWCRANANMENHYTLFSLSLSVVLMLFSWLRPAPQSATVWLWRRSEALVSAGGWRHVSQGQPQWSDWPHPVALQWEQQSCERHRSGVEWGHQEQGTQLTAPQVKHGASLPLPPHNIVWLFTLRCLNPMLRQSWRYLLFSNRSLIVSVSLTLFP